jgi:hypothetical protein
VLPFGWMIRYFFFAAFLAAFFAGAFLAAFFAAFLVAICLFSLFDGLHRRCNQLTAVDECIDSCIISVKKKTNEEWKNGQQFLGVALSVDLHLRIRSALNHSLWILRGGFARRTATSSPRRIALLSIR